MPVLPLSVQLEDKIVLNKRERVSKEASAEATKIVEQARKAKELQHALGLGDSKYDLQSKETQYIGQVSSEANALAKAGFQAVQEPSPVFFPRFAQEQGGLYINGMASTSVNGAVPQLVMVKLAANISKVYCRAFNSKGERTYYEAPIPIMPMSALEAAKQAKELAPDAEMHLLYMPSWEPAPLRDPVLVAHIPGTNEWFEIAAWNGDVALIKEFLMDA